MTKQRKEEHEEYKTLMANNGLAKELLGFAKNRLNQFYNPKLAKAAPKRQMSEEDRITVEMGGTLAPTAAPGGIAGTGIGAASFVQVKSRTEFENFMQYKKASQESAGVIQMINLLIA